MLVKFQTEIEMLSDASRSAKHIQMKSAMTLQLANTLFTSDAISI